jgi:hypothetical protein
LRQKFMATLLLLSLAIVESKPSRILLIQIIMPLIVSH